MPRFKKLRDQVAIFSSWHHLCLTEYSSDIFDRESTVDKSPADHVPEQSTVRYQTDWRGKAAPVRLRSRLNLIEAQRQIIGMKRRTKAVFGILLGIIISAVIWGVIVAFVV